MRSEGKHIVWLGDSRDRVRRFPKAARSEAGYQLSLIQAGRSPSNWKPMPVVGSGVIEIRIHADGEYRVFYAAKFEDAVYVLHAFVKKSQKTSMLDVELAKRRYRELLKGRK